MKILRSPWTTVKQILILKVISHLNVLKKNLKDIYVPEQFDNV